MTSQAFRPTKKDKDKLSVYDGTQISARDSWSHYTRKLKMESMGVMAITEEECDELELPVVFDGVPFPEHVSVVFERFSNKQAERMAQRLKKFAKGRGWQFQPP